MAGFSRIIRLGTRALRTPQGKRAGATAVEKAAGITNRVTGEKHAAHVEKARIAALRGLQRF